VEGVNFKEVIVTKRVAQKGVLWNALVRLGSGNVICGGDDKTIYLFDSQFNKVNSKRLSGILYSALLVGNYIYCGVYDEVNVGVGDSHVVMFDENLNEINRVKL
jgi:hypothetical protein